MLCKKCKTAISNSDINCAYCGSKIDRNRAKKASTALFICVLAIMLVFTYFARKGPAIPEETVSAAIPVTSVTEHPENEPVQITEPDDTAEEDDEKSFTEIYEMLNDAVSAAQEFHDKFSTYAVYVTNRGYLYEYLSATYITTRDFEAITDIKPENVTDDILILYLRPKDLIDYPDLGIIESPDLVIFAAYETKDGFILTSLKNGGGILPREDLRNVLAYYNNIHGEIQKIPKGSDDYHQISMLVGNLYNGRDSFDFRYLFRDDKYCVAVTSPKDNSININEHVFYTENNTWYMGLHNYEQYEKYKAVINSNFVDINLDLIPNYNMTTFSNYLRSDYSEVIRAMKLNSIITEDDEPMSFQSGTDDFCYLESVSGRKFVGNLNKEGMWEVREISSYEQGVERITGLTNKPPLFILKQY